ncbi:hypothetical protein AAHC03_05626 [Spirometra sp. Aus1]
MDASAASGSHCCASVSGATCRNYADTGNSTNGRRARPKAVVVPDGVYSRAANSVVVVVVSIIWMHEGGCYTDGAPSYLLPCSYWPPLHLRRAQ